MIQLVEDNIKQRKQMKQMKQMKKTKSQNGNLNTTHHFRRFQAKRALNLKSAYVLRKNSCVKVDVRYVWFEVSIFDIKNH